MPRAARLLLPLLLATLACSKPAPPAPPTPKEPPPAPPPAAVPLERETSARESASLVLARVDGATHAFVADEDDAAIVEIDLARDAVVAATTLGARPRDLLVLADGRLAATLPDDAAIAILSRDARAELHEVARVRTPAEPLAMALDPKDATLYASTGASHALVAFSASSLEEQSRAALGREPRAVLVSADGARVFVTHASESYVSVVRASGGASPVERREIGNHALCAHGSDCSGARVARNAQSIARVGEHGIVVAAAQSLPMPPRGFTKRVLCPPPRSTSTAAAFVPPSGIKVRTGYGVGNDEAGPPVIGDLATLDGDTGALFGVGMAPLEGPSCLLPRASVALGDDVIVACLGSARVVRYKSKGSFTFRAKGEGDRGGGINGFAANVAATPVAVPAGPTGVAIAREGKHVIVWSAFGRVVSKLDGSTLASVAAIDVPRSKPREQAWLHGRALFYTNGDKRISADGRACGNCHVDGRDDGLTWSAPQGMRRTRMLGGLPAQGPFGWAGEHPTLDAHVRVTVQNLGGTGLPDEDMAHLLTYVASLPKPPSSTVVDPEAARGRDLFASAECASCHTAGASDRTAHQVGTGGAFLTPTLAGIAMRSEMMHDGRYHTLEALLAGATQMGRGSDLSPDDRRALVRYLETL